MCKECGRPICPSSCPEFKHFLAGRGDACDFCGVCGGAIYNGERFYRRDRVAVCADCEKSLTLDELGVLLKTEEPLLVCGFEKVW